MNTTRILTPAQMRWADSAAIQAGTSGAELMDRAGLAVANAVQKHMPDYGRVVIVTGPGNNGGDGFAAAIYLRRKKIPVTVVSLVPLDSIKGDARAFADKAVEEGVKVRVAYGDTTSELNRWLLRAVMVVDAIFGTGLNRELDGEMAAAIVKINQAGRPVLSVDIASGLDADSGVVLGAAVHDSCQQMGALVS
jgi:NAD(P)H-hydrate epimerase